MSASPGEPIGDAAAREQDSTPEPNTARRRWIRWLTFPHTWVKQVWHQLLSQHTSVLRLAIAVGIGIFIGNLPFYGLHLSICIGVAWLFRLNQPTTYMAANISNPLLAPLLIFAAVQVGHRILVGTWLPLSIVEIQARGALLFLESWLLGSIIVGTILGVIGSGLTYAVLDHRRVKRSPLEPTFRWVVSRYRDAGGIPPAIISFVSSKLRRDPIFRALPEHLPEQGHVVDLGCGRGQLALMIAHRQPGRVVVSIDWDEAKVEAARRAAAGLAGLSFAVGDAREAPLPETDVVVMLDLLHYFPPQEQDHILERVVSVLAPGGRLLVREADAAGGLRFRITAYFERLALRSGVTRAPGLHFRTADALQEAMEKLGLTVNVFPMSLGTPLANVLLVGDLPGS